MKFRICSSAFLDGEQLPEWYASSGINASPPFGWTEEPKGTRSLALICHSSTDKILWVLWNIPCDVKTVYGKLPAQRVLKGGMCQGVNDLLGTGWTGPPEKLPDLSLTFSLYALDLSLNIPDMEVTASMLLSAMEGHVLGKTKVVCVFS